MIFRRARTLVVAFAMAMPASTSLSGCFAHVGGYDDEYYDEAPPSGYIATVDPYYYEGRPVYYWGGYWHYHDRGHWRHYRSEPGPLRETRMRGGPGPRWGGPARAAPAPAGRPFGGPARPVPGPRFGNPGPAPARPATAPGPRGGSPRFNERPAPRR